MRSPIPDQTDSAGKYFSFTFSDSAFVDDDGNNTLSYAATLGDGSPLPAWLSFSPLTRTFSGTPTERGTFTIKVTATDPAFASASTTFNLVITYGSHAVSLNAPNGGEVASGTYDIAWNTAAPSCTTDVSVSRDQGQTWTTVATGQSGSGQYPWNTAAFPDGVRYRARIFSYNAVSRGWDQSDGNFTVDNPGNGAPEVSTQADSAISGSYLWQWWSGDADGDQLFTTLAVRRPGQSGWTTVVDTLATGAANTRVWRQYGFTWNTDSMVNDRYQLKTTVFDGSLAASDSTAGYSTITNAHSGNTAGSVAGSSTIPFNWYVVHPDRLTGHVYEARFKPIVRNNYTLSTSLYPAEYKYDLWDITTPGLVWADRELPASLTAGACSYYDPGAEFTGCVPVCGSASFIPSLATMDSIKRPSGDPSIDTVKGVRINTPNMGWACLNTPMEIRWHVSGTAPNDTVWSEVWDAAYGVPIPYDSTGLSSQTVPSWNLGGLNSSLGKRYMAAASSYQRKFMNLAGYRLYFNNNAGSGSGRDMTWSTHPQEGDVWRVYYAGAIPPRDGDVFRFTPSGVSGNPTGRAPSLSLAQNRPNPFHQATDISFQLPAAVHVAVKVYNISGQLVTTLLNETKAPGWHTIHWNGCDEQRRRVSSGVYLYRLQAGANCITKKMTVLK